jgi:dTDP-4-amino-4,6-dideoxygalactose transaminase
MKTFPLFKVHVPIKEALCNIENVFDSGYINEGVEVSRLTVELQRHLLAKQLILTNSCTSALTLAMKLVGVGPNTDVVTTPMTCIATNVPIVSSGARIVWADVDREHGMIDPDSVRRCITDRTKAIIAVAWAGTAPDLNALLNICYDHKIKLILDAAHAFGAEYENMPIHMSAHYTTYSFQAIKHFTTGDGGALVCNNKDDYERSKSLKWFGLDREQAKDSRGDWKGQQWDVDIEEAGFKFNMNNVSAAIGLSQLPYIGEILKKHRENATIYNEELQHCKNVVPNWIQTLGGSSHWVYAVHVENELNRNVLLKALNDEGIMAGLVHVPNDEYTCFKNFAKDLPGVREFSQKQFALPCGWWLNSDDIRYIAHRVSELARTL